MAPTPASAQGTIEPTENQCDCTATPSSPVAGSRATIENVCTGRGGATNFSCAGFVCCACKPVATATNRSKAKSRRMTISGLQSFIDMSTKLTGETDKRVYYGIPKMT